MRSFDSLYHWSENGWSPEAQSHGDPVFTPLFAAVLGTAGIQFGAYTITYASIAAAIPAGGTFWEFSL